MISLTTLELECIYNVLRTIKEDPDIVPEIQEDLDDALTIIEETLRK